MKSHVCLTLAAGLLTLGACGDDGGSRDGAAGDAPFVGWPDGPLELEEQVLDQPGVTTASQSSANIAQVTSRFEMPARIAPTQRWTQRTNGLCGQRCRNGPRHMYSTAFGQTLLVSWMAVDPEDPWRHYGNVATFTVDAAGEVTLDRNVSFDGLCEATYGIAANDDGSVIAVLCRGATGVTTPHPQATDLLGARREAGCTEDWEGRCYPIGNYSALDSALYVLEYRGGAVDGTPDDIVYVNHAVGGWRYGHHEIMLNRAEDTYFIHLKVTAGPSVDNRHEGLTHFALRRTPEFEYVRVTDEWGCGAGHVLANRMAYNESEDSWAELCMLDACPTPSQYENGRCNSISLQTVPGVSGAPSGSEPVEFLTEYLLELDQGDASWVMSGGVGGLLSLGPDGWLALAAGPGYASAATKPDAIGLVRLPPSIPELRTQAITEDVPLYEGGALTGTQPSSRYQWSWLHLPDPDSALGRERRFGMPAMGYFCTDGERCERLLLGWSPSTATQGITSEYLVSEIDREGRLRGEPLRLMNAGWGEDNRWQTMPETGCIVLPFAWMGDTPGGDYPIERPEMSASEFPTTLHVTTLCPASDVAPDVAPTPPPTSDRERWPSAP